MSSTHQLEICGDVVTKTYVDWRRGEHLREWDVLRAVSAAKPDLAPVPLGFAFDEAAARGTGGRGAPAITMSWLPGQALGGSLSPTQLGALRVALDELWSIPSGDVEPIDVGRFIARVRQAVSSWSGEGLVAEAHAAAAEWLDGPAADELAELRDPVIGHGDPNLANYLWDGSRVRIIDFEDAGRSDLSVELANLVEHLASRGTDWSTFLDHYPVNADRLIAARRLFAAFWLTLIRPGGPSADRNPPGTAQLQAERLLRLLR